MRVTIAQLEAFFWTARLGSVVGAARQLRVAQPTISLRLRDLETSLGVQLFDGRRRRLTQEGMTLLEHAQAIMSELALINERLGSSRPVSGVVRVGVPETFALVCLPALLRRLKQEHPALALELVVATSFELEHEVREDRLDLAFTVNPTGDPGLRLMPLGRQATMWAASPRFGLGPIVRPADLKKLPIISNPPPSAMWRQIMDWFRTAGVEPQRVDLCNSVTVITHLVAEGVAVGFLPSKMVENELAAGLIVPLTGRPAVEPAWVYAAHRAPEATPSVGAVIRATLGVLREIDFLDSE